MLYCHNPFLHREVTILRNSLRVALFVTAASLTAPLLAQESTPSAAPATRSARADDEARQIIVTASPFGHYLEDTPAITATVSSEEILRAGGANLADALARVPGVAGTGFAAGASRPIIRGMDANRVRILENGTGVSDVSDVGPDHGVPIDPLAVRRIEVVRGAGTLRYGSQAIGGVVNAINNRVPLTRVTQPVSAELNGSYGTVDEAWQGAALVDAGMGNFALHADGFVRDTDDYDTPLGTQTNSFFRGRGGSIGASYFLGGGDSRVGAAVQQYDAKYGIPAEDAFIDMKQTKVQTSSYFPFGEGRSLQALTLDGSYADYEHSEIDPGGEINSTFLNKEYDARAELLLNPLGLLNNSAVGFEYQHRDFSALGEGADYLLPTETENVAGYLFLETSPVDPLHIEASGRIEHVTTSGTPLTDVFTKRDFTPLSGALGALYDVTDSLKLGLVFSSTGRAPAITELFARGPHDGPGTFEIGDPTLRIERSNSLEGSVRVRSGLFSFTGSAYSSWFNNYIYGDLTGRTCDEETGCSTEPDGELRELIYRQQGAHFRGLEGEASLSLVDSDVGVLEANLLADYVRATLDDDSNVPRIPPYRLGGGVDWTSDVFDAGVSLIYAGEQNKVGAFDSTTDDYFDLGAQVAIRPFRNYPGIELAVVGSNLTNEVQRNAAAFNKDEVVQPGRNVRFILKVANF